MAEETDAALAARAAAGDNDAYGEIVRRQQATVVAICRSVLKDPDEAWDAAQDAFIRLRERIGLYRGRASLKTFVSRVAFNAALDRLRRIRRRPDHAPGAYEAALLDDDGGARPDDLLERKELAAQLAEAFERLGPSHQAIVAMRELDGLPYAQIAKALRIPLGTVMSRLFYARQALRAILSPADELAPA